MLTEIWRRMKILHVIDSLATGGAERLVVDLAAYGIKQGHKVSIAVLQDSPGIPRERARLLGVPIHVIGTSVKDPRHIFRIPAIAKDVEIVHVHLFPALYWAIFSGRPMVYTEHSTYNRRMGKAQYWLLERLVYSRYFKIIAISEGVSKAAKRHLRWLKLNTRVSLAANGVSDEFFEVNRDYLDKPWRIVSIGSLRQYKQHHLAIEAVSKLKGVTLKIAGDGPLRQTLEAQIKEAGVGDRVTLLGNVSDIPQLLEESDLFLSTSSVEGFGIAACEAQASGIPVVGPNIPGLREVIPNGISGLLYESSCPESISRTLETALTLDTYKKLCQYSKENASRFSLANSFDAQMVIYREVLGGVS